MSNFRQGAAPKDTHQRLGKQDEEFRERHSSQGGLSSDNNQDEDFSEGHSSLMHMSSENKIQQQQQQPQLINGAPFRQGYPLKDSDFKESSEISSHSQQQALVTSPQGYPPKDDSPMNHQSSYPDLQQQQSSTKISTSQEHSSKGLQQQLLAEATQEQLPKEESSYNIRHLQQQQQQPSDCLQGEPPKPVHPLKPSTIPTRELSNTSCTQQDSTNDYDPHKSQSPSIKDPSAHGHAAPLKSVEHESINQKTVTKQKDETSTEKVHPLKVESSPKNIGVPRTRSKSPTRCRCSIL